jgi:hypothetical protein
MSARAIWGAKQRHAMALALGLAAVGCLDFLYDAATALAADIQGHAKRVSRTAISFEHRPDPGRGGCADAYKAQFSANAGLVVWCYAPGGGTQVVSSHITTSHLPWVDVPNTLIVDKQRGEALSIELTPQGNGKPRLTRAW